jgi:hypothetical protein
MLEDDTLSSQTDGMAMGSPFSLQISNISNKLKKSCTRHKIWLIYVDDIWPHDESKLNTFLNYLNGLKPTIKNIIEREQTQTLPFLDGISRQKQERYQDKCIQKTDSH